ncbi:MAG: hypothetical protein U0L98_01670 [Clostridia bacterium]|nr:hypothetical protein [Clostridia bacterium]
MKTNMMDLRKQARQLVLISKQKNIIKPHTEAFKDFPVSEEVNKGKEEK